MKNSTLINIIICGAAGRMGQRIIERMSCNEHLRLVGAIEAKGHYRFGHAVHKDILISDDLPGIILKSNVIIDFTTPQATLEHLVVAAENEKAVVIGTTGFKKEELQRVEEFAKKIPVLIAPNMSVGVNLLFKLTAQVAAVLKDYDAEIIELHHNQKKDAPSGTAMRLAEIIAGQLKRDLNKVAVYGRQGIMGARENEQIGVLAVRAGDIVGEHTVMFAGPGERIELIHRAHNRDTFANGALIAAQWLLGQPAGLYDMQDALGLK